MAGLDPAIHVFLVAKDADARHIGERSDAVLRTAMAGYDDGETEAIRPNVRHAPGNIAATRPAGPPPRRRDRRRRAAQAPAAGRAADPFERRRVAGTRPRPGARDR